MLICAFRSVDKPIPILLQRVYYIKNINIIVVFVRAACARASTVPSTSSSSSSFSSMRAVFYIIIYHIIFPRYRVAGS